MNIIKISDIPLAFTLFFSLTQSGNVQAANHFTISKDNQHSIIIEFKKDIFEFDTEIKYFKKNLLKDVTSKDCQCLYQNDFINESNEDGQEQDINESYIIKKDEATYCCFKSYFETMKQVIRKLDDNAVIIKNTYSPYDANSTINTDETAAVFFIATLISKYHLNGKMILEFVKCYAEKLGFVVVTLKRDLNSDNEAEENSVLDYLRNLSSKNTILMMV